MQQPVLELEDCTKFRGKSFGFPASAAGEVVFNTGMVGYVESLTDPSYCGQILCLSYPLIGNYGVPKAKKGEFFPEGFESEKIQVSGLIVADYSESYSHHAACKSLSEWLVEEKIPAITGIDTRMLVKILREKGTMLGRIVLKEAPEFEDPNARNLVREVSTKKPVLYKKGRKTVALLDCGTKQSILRSLLERNISVLRVPWNYDLFEEEEEFDAIIASNGPGNPALVKETISILQKALKERIPSFGICLGNQLLALAAGAQTYKLKYGHRSQNQPCMEAGSKRCFITSQNHGFAVQEKSLPQNWEVWFKNANDSTVEGIRHKRQPFKAVQFHPEANPGPTDTAFLFDEFLEELK